ncbi:MAG TPA: endonuclease/exonuclease/phosphatase family protein, partial [Phycisphaerales bacterium]|nr:endonuclease/exonuclease/phosphatase family protein [Phycisphaerales bacterium]
ANDPVAVSDPADAPDSIVDFRDLKVSADGFHVGLLAQWSNVINLQGLKGEVLILVNADGSVATGTSAFKMPGVDFAIAFSPPEDHHPGRGAAIVLDASTLEKDAAESQPGGAEPAQSATPAASQPTKKQTVNPYDLKIEFAPTYAADTNEIRFTRGVKVAQILNGAPLFAGKSAQFKFVFLDLDGKMKDETDIVFATLPEFGIKIGGTYTGDRETLNRRKAVEADPLVRLKKDSLRVLAWNVEMGHIFTNPEPYARILNAVNPDVVMFEELKDQKDSSGQQELFVFLHNRVPPGGGWYVQYGPGGGDLHCAVASRSSLDRVAELTTLPDPVNPKYTARTMSAVGTYQDRKILFTAVHLKCCGNMGSSEDEERIKESTQIHDAIVAAEKNSLTDAVIIAGDFNLVGTREPLDGIGSGIDADGSELGVALPLHFDGESSYTWRDRYQPFLPSRLDFMLYSDSRLKVDRCFVMDTADLSAEALKHYGLEADDSAKSSDHLPIVVDFVWNAQAQN